MTNVKWQMIGIVSRVLFILHPSAFILELRSELELNQPLGFFRPALILLSYPTREIAKCRLPIDRLHTGRIQERMKDRVFLFHPSSFRLHSFALLHKEVLTPLSACFCVVAKHHPLELHTQR